MPLESEFPTKRSLPDEFNEELQFLVQKDKSEIPLFLSVCPPKLPVVVIGSGPAGLFAAYVLALRGIPLLLLERGATIEKRTKDVQAFWEEGVLNPQSNVLFGEGGAGTFSDGKADQPDKESLFFLGKKDFSGNGRTSNNSY